MHLKANIKGVLTSYTILFFLGLGLSTYYHFGSLSGQVLGYLVSFIVATGFLLGGFMSGYTAGEKGLINGIISAVIGVGLILIFLGLGSDSLKDWTRFVMNSIFAFLASSIGGIIGVSKH